MSIITLSTSAAMVVPPNALRKSLVFQNEDSIINIFLKKEKGDALTVSSTVHDHRLGPGDAIGLAVDLDGNEATTERWTAIAASGTPILSFFENETLRR